MENHLHQKTDHEPARLLCGTSAPCSPQIRLNLMKTALNQYDAVTALDMMPPWVYSLHLWILDRHAEPSILYFHLIWGMQKEEVLWELHGTKHRHSFDEQEQKLNDDDWWQHVCWCWFLSFCLNCIYLQFFGVFFTVLKPFLAREKHLSDHCCQSKAKTFSGHCNVDLSQGWTKYVSLLATQNIKTISPSCPPKLIKPLPLCFQR